MCDTSRVRRYRLPLARALLAWGLALPGLAGGPGGTAAGEQGPDLSDDRLLALVRPELAERVKLTAEQKEAVGRIAGQLHARLETLINESPKGPQDTEGIEGRRQVLKEVAGPPRWGEEAARRIRELLTTEQRAALARV